MPGSRLLLAPLCAVVLVAAGCGGGNETAATTRTITVQTETTTDTSTAGATSTAGETSTETGTTTGADASGGNAQAGAKVFASAGCGGCHTLKAAGASGNVCPNLDQRKPSFDKVVERVTQGKSPMPSFNGQLTKQQIDDVAAYVSSSTGGS